MDGLDDNVSNNTNVYCTNVSQIQVVSIFGIISTLLLLVPSLILQLFFICRYKSTFIHRQFLYTTIVVILLGIIYTVYPSSFGCLTFSLFVYSLNRYLMYVEILQITTIHLLLLYKFSKHMETRIMQTLCCKVSKHREGTRTTQRLQTLCSNIRPRLWHEVVIVCIQLGLPLPILIAYLYVPTAAFFSFALVETYCFFLPLLATSILLDLVCIVLLVVWLCKLWKRKLLRSKAKFVCTQMGHIIFVLVVFLIGNILIFFSGFFRSLEVIFAIQTVVPVSFGVYIIISLPSLKRKVPTRALATNRHTNPPSTRVSLPTDTAEHAPNFLSPSTAEPSEVTLLVND